VLHTHTLSVSVLRPHILCLGDKKVLKHTHTHREAWGESNVSSCLVTFVSLFKRERDRAKGLLW
jgi:hypothetical protein